MKRVVRFLLVLCYAAGLLVAAVSIVDAKVGKGGSKNSRTGDTSFTGAANQPKSAAQSVSPVVRDHSGSSPPLPSTRCGGGHGCAQPRTGGK
jgi:hypothetical protein